MTASKTLAAKPSVAIVIPALNEEGAIGPLVRALQVHPALQTLPIAGIYVVDNGSTDGTAEAARMAGAEVVSEPRRGYGQACLAGVLRAAAADIILLMDGDGSDDLDGVARVAREVVETDADLVVGSRSRGHSERGALTPHQRAGNFVGSLVLRLVYGLKVSDLGPTRAIRRTALLRLKMSEMSYGWSTEMLAKAARAGLRVREVPVDYHRRSAGESKVAGTLSGSVTASIHILKTLARYRRWSPTSPPDRARQALFIVSRLPEPGKTKTRLGRAIGHDAAATLYTAFLRDLGARMTEASQRDSFDLFWYCALPPGRSLAEFAPLVPSGGELLAQHDGAFGERLLAGFREVAARGYERIVVLGSDSPHVPSHRMAQAFHALETHDVVIGPAQDGGYYLLGERTPLCDCFSGIEMSTPRVFEETVAHLHAAGKSIALLSQTFDVDEFADLKTLRDALAAAPSWQADPCPVTSDILAAIPLSAMPVCSPDAATSIAVHPTGGVDVA